MAVVDVEVVDVVVSTWWCRRGGRRRGGLVVAEVAVVDVVAVVIVPHLAGFIMGTEKRGGFTHLALPRGTRWWWSTTTVVVGPRLVGGGGGKKVTNGLWLNHASRFGHSRAALSDGHSSRLLSNGLPGPCPTMIYLCTGCNSLFSHF